MKKLLKSLKYPIAIALLALVLQQADLDKIIIIVASANPLWLVLAFLSLTIAQLFTVIRMNAYYQWIGRPIGFFYSLKLHYVALFYNIILPGGIGGDGYKVFLLKSNAGYPAKEGIKIQLLTRTNGLSVLLMSILAFACFLPHGWPILHVMGACFMAAMLMLASYVMIVPRVLGFARHFELQALPYSLGVQGFTVLSMVMLWFALGAEGSLFGYMLLFQIAAIAGMIPITIGGLGIREMTFFYGAALLHEWFNLSMDAELGITISLMMFAVTLLSAFLGLPWIHRISQMNPCATVSNQEKL